MRTDGISSAPLLLGGHLQRLRIASGLVLFTFAFFHFLNHALGLWSIEVMEAFQEGREAVTRSLPGTIILFGAFFTHIGLNLYKTSRRTTWRMPVWEATQILLGLTILPLLMYHAAFMAAMERLEGTETPYSDVLPHLWGELAWLQSLLLLIVWVHGCIGLHFWLRLVRFYRRVAPVLFAIAILVPTLALAGFSVAGRDAIAEAEAAAAEVSAASPGGRASDGGQGASGWDDYGYGSDTGGAGYGGYGGYGDAYAPPADPAPRLTAAQTRAVAVWSALGLIAAVFLALALRRLMLLWRRRMQIGYSGGPTVLTPVGPTLLEISRLHRVPHSSVCGGRGRCSTCRVRIETGGDTLPPPSTAEAATLDHIGAPREVRLACQVRPGNDLLVVRLVQPPAQGGALLAAGSDGDGVERTLAVLFLDIRGFTTLSEARLPYDTVFLLNRFFSEIGDVLNESGGWIDKYLGDGLMALFGLNQPTEAACRSALVAAMKIDAALERVNDELSGELPAPLRIGMGLHVGPLVLGRIGHRASAATTVIGPAVNTASRLEALTKEHGVQIIASAAVGREAGLPEGAFPETTVTVRGTREPIKVLLIDRGRALAAHVEAGEKRPAA